MTNDELTAYYTDLLILQYKGKPRARAHVETFLRHNTVLSLFRRIEQAYHLDGQYGSAKGVHLDVIAKYIGVPRRVKTISAIRKYFGGIDASMEDRDLWPLGSIDYGAEKSDVQILTYVSNLTDSAGSELEDDRLLSIVKKKQFVNSCNMSLADIDDYLELFYGKHIVVNELGDANIRYIVNTENINSVIEADKQNAFPRPAGVGVSIPGVDTGTKTRELVFTALEYGEVPPEHAIGALDYGEDHRGRTLQYGDVIAPLEEL